MSTIETSNSNQLQREAGMMDLQKLIDTRESISETQFPIEENELLERFESTQTAVVCDVLREHCLLDQAFPHHLQALCPKKTVAGIAFTVKSSPNTQITGEMTFRGQMLDTLHRNAFVVWDTSRDEHATLWGGVMTATVIHKGVKAAMVDGGIRDTRQILEKEFPIFYRYKSPNGSLSRCLITHYQIPVKIGDVFVRPGDVILGDADGVICIPRDIAHDVLLRAEQIINNEKKIFDWVNEGQSIKEITEKGGYF
ncbi:RraA family protein [Advenella mimigardefordensis]|uniref:Putative 4-hydroxy-4-methyl-2-oxoglutarate aldolase n=1 Tax=Advenella mimigardefordensis (strain DSM 17166 / LMG 22922 / DPN7) TaxID=1247726 RepID=W0PII3_ADVMD|nr:RraA family protein [Advenella mimigardefordensis]AHG65240.1 putative methyltransferase [Advenella mimigardefordensis DPN7]